MFAKKRLCDNSSCRFTLKGLNIEQRVKKCYSKDHDYFKYSPDVRHFVCKLSLIFRRNFATEQCWLSYLLVYQISKRNFGYDILWQGQIYTLCNHCFKRNNENIILPSPKAIDRWRSAYGNAVISHIRKADWKIKRLQRRCQSVRKQFEDFLWMKLWLPTPCSLSQAFDLVLI